MTNRLFPTCPRAGASLALFRDNRVLLARRGAQAGHGLWSLPGGLIELGETAEAAALREMQEELGVTGTITGLAGHLDIIEFSDKNIRQHYIVLTFAGRWCVGRTTNKPGSNRISLGRHKQPLRSYNDQRSAGYVEQMR